MQTPETDTAFPPVIGETPQILILGSMPGQRSLAQQQYYAHSRNAFWPIIRQFLGLPNEADYSQCCDALTRNRLALWDVLAQCTRPGSLDQHIDPASVVVNDFEALLRQYPSIQRILFNGGKAADLFERHALLKLSNPTAVERVRLPSTSPANAAMRFEEKYHRWAAVLTGPGCR